MAHQVQSRAGITISDVYDVKGSQAPVETIDVKDIKGVHEFGQTIQSERFSSTVRRRSTGALLQNATFDEVLTDLPAGVSRILGMSVLTDVPARTSICTVSVRDPIAGREVPIFIWELSSVDSFKDLRIDDNGAGAANMFSLAPSVTPVVLSMITGEGQPQRVSDIAFRGVTTGFGAGTVTHILVIHLAFAAIGGISSRGLPIPSW